MNENTIPAVEKTVQLIEYLGSSEVPLTRGELAEHLGLSASTCYRILQTLQNSDWVRKTDGSRYRLSGGLLSAIQNITEESNRYYCLQPLLTRLARETDLGCKLSVRMGENQITILRADPLRNVHVSGKIGGEFPLIEGSVGAVLLSGESEREVARHIRNCNEDIPEKHDMSLLAKRMIFFKQHGYVENEANRWKVHAMSVPVYEAGRVSAALTLLGWEDDFRKERAESLPDTLKRYAKECSEYLQ